MLLYNLHIAAFLIHLVSFALSLFTHIKDADVDILVAKHIYKTNELGITTTDTLTTLNANSWVSINEGLTCFSHAIALYLLYGKEPSEEINNLEHGRRAVEYSFTAGILAVALVLSVGSIFLQDLLFILGINVVIQGLGWLIHYEDDKREINFMYMGAFLLLALEIVYVLLQTYNIAHPDDFDLGFYQAMGIIFGILYISFGLVKFFVKNRDIQDEMYVIMSVSTKVILSWIIIANTHQGFIDLFDMVPVGVHDLDWRAIELYLTVILLIVMVGGLFYVYNRERKKRDYKPISTYVGTVTNKNLRYDL